MTQIELFTHIIDFERGALIMFCLCWAYYFFTYRGNQPQRKNTQMRDLVGWLMLWKAAAYLFRIISWLPQTAFSERFALLSFQLDMVTVAWVVIVLTGFSRRRHLKWWLLAVHLLPVVLLITLNFCFSAHWVWWISYTYICAYALVFLVLCGRSVLRYNAYIHDEYIIFSRHQLTCSTWLMILMVIQFAIWSVMFWLPYRVCDVIYYGTSLVLWTIANLNIDYILKEREESRVDVSLFPLSLDELEEHKKQEIAQSLSDEPIADSADSRTDDIFSYRLRTLCEDTKLYAMEGVTRDDLARAMHINHTYFTQMLRQTTGKTFYEYINSLRMRDALVLLSDPDFPLDSIPFEVGYRHKSTYYRVFQDKFGCKPQQWREKNLPPRNT